MIKARGVGSTIQKIDLWVRRVEEQFVADYRGLIWETLRELVLTTPQWSGHAAANWNIGIDEPDLAVHSHEFKMEAEQAGPNFLARQVGDMDPWMAVDARYGGGAVLKNIRRRSRVFFTNSVVGTEQWGSGAEIEYLARLQNPAWHSRLRVVNLPYETAQEVIVKMDSLWRLHTGHSGKRLGFGRMSGYSFNAEFS